MRIGRPVSGLTDPLRGFPYYRNAPGPVHSRDVTVKVKNYLRMTRILAAFLSMSLLLPSGVTGQDVGIVLSGGGAKGLYHIGVIKALEENSIPIDYISGTSIGAVIGGLYAAGYSPEQIEAEFSSARIQNILSGRLERDNQYYFKQMHQNAAMITIRLDLKNKGRKARIPPNIVPTEPLDMAIAEFFTPATAAYGGDFDSLMVPFRCVATDAAGRQEVVFRGGDLGKAVRASIAVPLVFSPVRDSSALYYDGGIFDNFPWRPVYDDFRPDILIGSICTETGVEPDDMNSIDQVFTVTTIHTDYSLPRESDIIISRDFSGVTTMDFARAVSLIEAGYEDAVRAMPVIKGTIRRRVPPGELARKREEFASRTPGNLMGSLRVDGLNAQQVEYVEKTLGYGRGAQEKGYDFDDLERGYYKLIAEGEMTGQYPSITYNSETGKYDAVLYLTAKPSFRIMAGGNVSSTALNQAYVGMELKYLSRVASSWNLDGYFSSFYSSAAARGRVDFFLSTRPVYFGYGGSMNFYNYFKSNYGFLTKGNDITYSKFDDHYGTVALGTPVSRHSVVSLRMNGGRNEYRYFQQAGYESADTMDRTRFVYGGLQLEMDWRKMNYAMYPTRGVRQTFSVIGVRGIEYFKPGTSGNDLGQDRMSRKRQWYGAKFSREQYFRTPPVKWFSWGYLFEGVATTHPNFGNEYATNISSPAFTPTPHSRTIYMKEFHSETYVAAGLMPTFEFTPSFYLKMSAYVFIPDNYDGVKESIRQRTRTIFDGSMVYQTFLGPISLSVSKYDTRRNNWFMTFNFGLAVFNRKGLFY